MNAITGQEVEEFMIDINIPLQESFNRVLKERIRAIEEQVRQGEDIHVVIHETRRSIKRIRGILKMIRDEIGFSNYYRENLFFRDLARGIAAPRDSYALLKTFENIRTVEKGMVTSKVTRTVNELISEQLLKDLNHFLDESGGMGQLLSELSFAQERIDHYCTLRNGFISIKKGIRRIYRRGRRQQARIHESFEMESFHEYRKNTKYLQFHMELIRPLYPKILNTYSLSLDKYSELLGEIRDTDRLLRFIKGEASGKITASQQKKVAEGIMKVRDRMLENALEDSRVIYAAKPGELIRRINIYWKHGYPINQS